jgi:NTP pyrophosphatase (non-canonical NTP hydrolase)
VTREEREAAVDWFAERIKQKLREPRNEAKPSWRDDDLPTLFGKLADELAELDEAIAIKKNVSAIIDEAVDCAAYSMAIADLVRSFVDER